MWPSYQECLRKILGGEGLGILKNFPYKLVVFASLPYTMLAYPSFRRHTLLCSSGGNPVFHCLEVPVQLSIH